MLQYERFKNIQEITISKKFVTVDELCEMLKMSKATIRRDLKILEKEGKITRTHGGAASDKVEKEIEETPYSITSKININEKTRIGIAAANHIKAGSNVIFDAGTTIIKAAEKLALNIDYEVMATTHDLKVALELSKNESIKLTIAGGTRRKGFYVVTGYFTQYMLDKMHFDMAFLGFDALSPQLGCMTCSVEEVALKKIINKSSSYKIALCDHTKFLSQAQFVVCDLSEINLIITGKELDEKIAKQILEMGIKLELV